MSAQLITTELRRWIVDQTAAGHPPDIIIDAMKASGWDGLTARDALATTLRDQHRVAAGESIEPEPARPVPGAHIGAGSPLVNAGDREVRVLMALALPRVVVFGDLIPADECAELIALARSRLARSETVETATGASAVNEAAIS